MLETKQIFQQRYQLKEKLAQNAGRQTWLAEDISIQPAETVILKFLSFGENFQWQDLKLFEREADILKQLSHPKIPKYRDYFSLEDNNHWFALVEEYIPGESLKQLIDKKQRFTEEELRKIASEVLDILCYLHTLNPQVIHRDVKPSNLILGIDKKVYLIDFGAVQDNAAAKGATFTIVGTYGYAPIEQFGGRTVPASDLYALGATLIHLATGRIPADLPQKRMRIQFQEQVSLSNHFVSWIEKLIEPDIEDRFTSAEEALANLNSRLAVNSSTKIYQSNNSYLADSSYKTDRTSISKVKINKSEDRLEIEIPSRGMTLAEVFTIFVLMLIFAPFGLIVLCIACIFISSSFYLKFNRENFVMYYELFNLKFLEKKGKVSNIDYFTIDNTQREQSKTISICVGGNRYECPVYLADSEKEGLTREIKNWLYS